jgi:hypothetical protein
MELIQILIHGAIAGLIAGTLNAIVAPLFILRAQVSPSWRAQSVVLQLTSIGLHLLAGLALALLFWLSWGLIAIVSVAWWQRGLSFALLTWIALSWPLLANQVLQTRVTWPLVAKTAWDALCTCLLVGMACAWIWRNGP